MSCAMSSYVDWLLDHLERLETPPNPSLVIPFSHNAEFVVRRIILNQIYEKCAIFGARTALVGLGVVG
ncbi:hypothetical protein CJF31_00011296 [Rutstroemia sp. NJR-2017a BVV2]|nr:hypothetical protein CJF31_00011296 [Rutstroemia sp. NJR-2017a BVV2]